MPRRKDEAVKVVERPMPRAKAVTTIFNPTGNVRVNLTAPSGNKYHIEPRQPFKIASEDVDWFFNEWDWQYRQSLTRAEDYVPTAGYLDTTPGIPSKVSGNGGYLDTMPDNLPAPAAEYHDTGDDAPGITSEERETRERGVQPEEIEETEPVMVKTGTDE